MSCKNGKFSLSHNMPNMDFVHNIWSKLKFSKVWRLNKQIIGHIGDGFIRVKWPNQYQVPLNNNIITIMGLLLILKKKWKL